MAKAKTQEVTDPYSPEVIELMIEYKKRWRNLPNAMRDMSKMTGLEPEICRVMLEMCKSLKVVEIRGYSKIPQTLVEGKRKKAAQRAAQFREA
jgi:hypothetical protein